VADASVGAQVTGPRLGAAQHVDQEGDERRRVRDDEELIDGVIAGLDAVPRHPRSVSRFADGEAGLTETLYAARGRGKLTIRPACSSHSFRRQVRIPSISESVGTSWNTGFSSWARLRL
jgi:hypothetical protein